MKKRHKQSQKDMVYQHLNSGSHLTPLEAIGVYGIYRLAARVHEVRRQLRAEGDKRRVFTEVTHDGRGRPYARYTFVTRRQRGKFAAAGVRA